jgi:hypothetical protein
MIEPDLDYANDIEVLLFLEHLARGINDDLELGLSVPAMRRVARRVLDAEPEGAEELHRTLGGLLLRERTVH